MKANIISLLMLFVLCACDVDNSSISNSVESDLPTSTSESIDSSSPSSEENKIQYEITIIDTITNSEVSKLSFDENLNVTNEDIRKELLILPSIRHLYVDSTLTEKFSSLTMTENVSLYLGLYEYSEELHLSYVDEMVGYYRKNEVENFYTTYVQLIYFQYKQEETSKIYYSLDDLKSVMDEGITDIINEETFNEYAIMVNKRTSFSSKEIDVAYRNVSTNESGVSIEMIKLDDYHKAALADIVNVYDIILIPLNELNGVGENYTLTVNEIVY